MNSHFQAYVKRFLWILQNSDVVQFRPILDMTSRFAAIEIQQLRISFKFVWRTENGIKDQILNLSWSLDVILLALLEFRGISAHIHSLGFKPQFRGQNDDRLQK